MKKLLTFTSLIILAACTSSSDISGEDVPAVHSFTHLETLFLNVQNVNTIDDTYANSSTTAPEHFYVPVRDMFNNYVDGRYHASSSGQQILDIQLEKYDVSYQQKDSQNGMAKFIGVARVDQYVVDMGVNLTLSNPDTGGMKGRRLNVSRIMNISEHVSIAEREQHQMDGVEKMIVELDQGIIEVLRNDFGLSF